MPRPKPRSIRQPLPAGLVAEPRLLADVQTEAAALGERLRRAALGLTSALIVVRAYWPAEYGIESRSGSGLCWSLLMLVAAILALTGMWLEGGLRLRLSWADAGVVSLIVLVGISASHAAERRIAINFAWDWAGVGLGYLLMRNLPRTRSENAALAGALVATAIALAVYGMFQIAVEFPRERAFYLANPREALGQAGLNPNAGSQEISRFRDRLLGSREPIATFALTNTLAGFLVGPAAVALAMALRAVSKRGPWRSLAAAAPLAAVLLVCLMLTKSRSAYLGLFAAMIVLVWLERRRITLRRLSLSVLGALLVVVVTVAVAARAGQLDRQVLTQSFKSLSYRWEYWRGAWGVITDGRTRWLAGVGPGNFGGPYLQHKLPGASEEIIDPHNLFLEVWATAGLPALIALVVGLGFGLRECLAKSEPARVAEPSGDGPEPMAPASSTWLVISAGLGAWLLVIALGKLSPFEPDPTGRRMILGLSPRWLILGGAWLAAIVLGRPFWNRLAVTSNFLGLGAWR